MTIDLTPTINPSLPEWIRDHLSRYIESNGEDGHMWRGMPTLLLTTVGSQSGKARTTPLIYGRSGEDLVIVASKGGAPEHPSWYQNLVAQSEVGLQVEAERYHAVARTAAGEERAGLFAMMEKVLPAYAEYAEKTSREIPVVVLSRL